MFEVLGIIVPIIAAVALITALLLALWVRSCPEGTDRMKEIAGYIRTGAMAFLRREYQFLIVLIIVVFLVIGFAIGWPTAILYVNGSVFSVLAGFFGMKVATWGNARTANAAKEHGLPAALKVAFRSGAVMGLCVVGLGVLGLGYLYVIMGVGVAEVVTGFGLGASSVALFGRVGGGIYTKAADVGADLVGKVEAGIPEDDPRNPAVIADNVGDNVGDVAGMGSDLFESYVGSIISAITLSVYLKQIVPSFGAPFDLPDVQGIVFPLLLSALGVAASIIGIFFVRGKHGGNPATALNMGTYVSSAIVIIASIIMSKVFFGNFNCAIAIIAGLIVGVAIGKITEVYTSSDYKHVKHIAQQSLTGEATTIISGIGVGMLSTIWPIICIAIGIFAGSKRPRFLAPIAAGNIGK